MATFREDLAGVINRHSLENGSDTPDYILAGYLSNCLRAFDNAVNARKEYFTDNDKQVPEQPELAAIKKTSVPARQDVTVSAHSGEGCVELAQPEDDFDDGSEPVQTEK